MRRTPKRSNAPNRLTGLLCCADCGAKLIHRNSLVQGKYIDDAFICSKYRGLVEDCTIHYVSTQKLETAILSAIQRISWYVRNNEQEFIQRVREASSLRQEETAKDCRKQIAQAKKRHAELDGLVKKLYEANATGKLPDKHFSRLLAEYDEEQATLEASIAEWERLLVNWNADRVKMAEFIDLAKRYTDFSELTTPMLNEFIEKIVVHEGEGWGNQRCQRLDFYFNFIGAFEVPANIVTPMEQEAEYRQQEKQAEKEKRSQELAQARYEKYKQERREFTARKRAGLLTPEEQAKEERRLERNRTYQKMQRDKKKVTQPEKPRKHSLEELSKLERAGADLTLEEAERLAAYKQRKAEAAKRCKEKRKTERPSKPQQRTLKELAECSEAGLPLALEEAERLEVHRNRKKTALQDLKTRAETDPVAAKELAKQRALQSEAAKKSWQKMYEDAAAGDPEAQARYERFLATRRENYHRKKQEIQKSEKALQTLHQ